MIKLLQIPEWIATPLIGAIIAALGYVSKLLIDLIQSYRNTKRIRKSKLIELHSLLNATGIAFKIQNKHAKTLTESITKNYQEISKNYRGYEEKISRCFHLLNIDEKELHSIIRSITINTLYSINVQILDWIKNDTYFKANKSKDESTSSLSTELMKLETHLLLWIAKFEAWIPNYPEHALVYMADEKEHGLGFPKEIDQLVDKAVKNFK